MKTSTKLIGVCLLIFAAIMIVGASVATYGDITCNEKFYPRHIYVCYRADGGIDKGFNTYEAMNAYYVPPREETIIPPDLYVYGGSTETLSGS